MGPIICEWIGILVHFVQEIIPSIIYKMDFCPILCGLSGVPNMNLILFRNEFVTDVLVKLIIEWF